MRRFTALAVVLAWATLMLGGCGDPVDRLLASEDERTRLWERVGGSPELAFEVIDRLVSADSTRDILFDRLLASGGARQELLARVARDRTLLDGTVHFAVQDSAMRDHLLTLVRGMQMVGAR